MESIQNCTFPAQCSTSSAILLWDSTLFVSDPLMSASTWFMVLAGLAIAVLAGPLYHYCESAGAQLVDGARYVQAVLGS